MKSFVPLDNIDSVLSILSKIAIWGGLSDEERSKVFKRLEVGFFKKGEYIFQKGDQPSHIYIVKSGKIDLFISDRDTIIEKETLAAGGCFGVAALMAMATHMGTAIAREDSEILVLSRQSLLELRHEDIHLFALLMMNIAREIARRLKLTDDILLNYVHGHKDPASYYRCFGKKSSGAHSLGGDRASGATGRNSIGVEIDPEYCRMIARYLKAENSSFFSEARLLFEKVSPEQTFAVMEDQALYEVKPAKKKLTINGEGALAKTPKNVMHGTQLLPSVVPTDEMGLYSEYRRSRFEDRTSPA